MNERLARDGIQRVLVFRALMLGDMLCATPALRALRAALPTAQITLVGLQALCGWAQRQPAIDDFVAFTGWPGLPEVPVPPAPQRASFVAALQGRHFDLALQLHGSGGIVNPLVASFGAARNAGFCSPGSWLPPADQARFAPWPTQGSEVERLLTLTDHLGLPRQGLGLEFPLQPADREQARALLTATGGAAVQPGRYAVVHPGSQLPSRRWPAERFAEVADALAAQGLAVVLTGSAGEAPLVADVAQAMRQRPHNLAGRTDLWTLGGLIEGAAVLVSNDTGVSHIAAALRTPSVVVASGSDVARWAPHDGARHRVFWHDMPCRPCAAPVCPHGQACALAVPAATVAQAALRAAGRASTRPAQGPAAATSTHFADPAAHAHA